MDGNVPRKCRLQRCAQAAEENYSNLFSEPALRSRSRTSQSRQHQHKRTRLRHSRRRPGRSRRPRRSWRPGRPRRDVAARTTVRRVVNRRPSPCRRPKSRRNIRRGNIRCDRRAVSIRHRCHEIGEVRHIRRRNFFRYQRLVLNLFRQHAAGHVEVAQRLFRTHRPAPCNPRPGMRRRLRLHIICQLPLCIGTRATTCRLNPLYALRVFELLLIGNEPPLAICRRVSRRRRRNDQEGRQKHELEQTAHAKYLERNIARYSYEQSNRQTHTITKCCNIAVFRRNVCFRSLTRSGNVKTFSTSYHLKCTFLDMTLLARPTLSPPLSALTDNLHPHPLAPRCSQRVEQAMTCQASSRSNLLHTSNLRLAVQFPPPATHKSAPPHPSNTPAPQGIPHR